MTAGNGAGWRTPDACRAAGVTYRQADYWTRCGYVVPSVAEAHGTGTQRLYSTDDVVMLAIVGEVLAVGNGPRRIVLAVAAATLARRAGEGVAQITVAISEHVTLTVDVAAIRADVTGRLAILKVVT